MDNKPGKTQIKREINKVFLRDLIKVFAFPTLINKFLMFYFGINYSLTPGEGYGYGLVATIVFLFINVGFFLWKYRHIQDP